jgi:nucleotide-binding universal stress UspA family protein
MLWINANIVVGTKGWTGLVKFLLGSVAGNVVAHAHCRDLAVRELTDSLASRYK